MQLTKGLYEIKYSTGVIQEKYLVHHEDYLNIIKPLLEVKAWLEFKKLPETTIQKVKETIFELVGEDHQWFTDNSPIFKGQIGDITCTIKKL